MNELTDLELMIFEKQEIDCGDTDHLLCDYVDDELCDVLRNRLNAHLYTCAVCRESVARYQEVVDLAGEIGRNAPPVSIAVKNNLRQGLNAKLGLNLPTVAG